MQRAARIKELLAQLNEAWRERQKLLRDNTPHVKKAFNDAVAAKDGIDHFTTQTAKVASALIAKNKEIDKILESVDAPENEDGDFVAETTSKLNRLLRPTGALLDKKKVQGKVQYLLETVVSATSLTKQWVTKVPEAMPKDTVAAFDVQFRLEHVRHGAFDVAAPNALTRRTQGLKAGAGNMPVGKWLQLTRDRLKATQKSMCGYCKETLPLTFHIDHVNEDPGNNSDTNLAACCPTCHDRKGRAYSNRKDYILRPMIYRLNINRRDWGQDPVPAVWLENYSKTLHFPQYRQYMPRPAQTTDAAYKKSLENCKVAPMEVAEFRMNSVPRLWRKKNPLVGKTVTVKFNDGDDYTGTVTARMKTSHIATARQYKVQYDDKDVWTHNVEKLLAGQVETTTKLAVGDFVMVPIERQTFTGLVLSTQNDAKYTVLLDNGSKKTGISQKLAEKMRLRFLLLLQEEQDAMWQAFVPRTKAQAKFLTKAFTANA